MKRFSQRNALVTLSEINITPLLDLAFVLLIIFIITRPLLEQNIDLKLPENMGGPDTRTIDRRNIRVVEITARGDYWLQGRHLSFAQVDADLAAVSEHNRKLIVDIRADKRTEWEHVITVINACNRHHITISVRTAPIGHP
ncbi:MAG: biopolymer transporter ExbD [Verrucomicrobiota bacterium]|jgi:biopolymer transport protein ExbD